MRIIEAVTDSTREPFLSEACRARALRAEPSEVEGIVERPVRSVQDEVLSDADMSQRRRDQTRSASAISIVNVKKARCARGEPCGAGLLHLGEGHRSIVCREREAVCMCEPRPRCRAMVDIESAGAEQDYGVTVDRRLESTAAGQRSLVSDDLSS